MDRKLVIAIINTEDKLNKVIQSHLNSISGTIIETESGNLKTGYDLIKKIKPDIIILNLVKNEDLALNFAKRVSQNFVQAALFLTAPAAGPETIIRAMRAGASEFFMQPLKKDELKNAVKSILEKQSVAESTSKGKIISVFGAKGGVGTTTIATNTAVSLAKHSQKDVILVDFNLQLGNCDLYFNVKPQYSILEVSNNIAQIDPKLLKDTLPKHSSGVFLLARPTRIEEAESITISHVEQIISLLRQNFDYIIIDSNSIFDELTIHILDESDLILTVTTLDIPSVFNIKRCLEIFSRMQYSQEKVMLILNRYATTTEIDYEALEKSINYPIFWRIPNQHYANIIKSLNQGIPISMMMPRAKISINFNEMVQSLNGEAKGDTKEINSGKKISFLKKILKPKGKANGPTQTVEN